MTMPNPEFDKLLEEVSAEQQRIFARTVPPKAPPAPKKASTAQPRQAAYSPKLPIYRVESPRKTKRKLNIVWWIAGAVVAAFVLAVILPEQSGNIIRNKRPPANLQYFWNMKTYHSGTTIAQHSTPNFDMKLNKRGSANVLIIIYKYAKSYIPPSNDEIKEIFGEALAGQVVDETYGHVPFVRGENGLIRYELPTIFTYTQVASTGFGYSNPDYSSVVRDDVSDFLSSERNNQRVLKCLFDTGSDRSAYYRLYWYKKRPDGLEDNSYLRRLGSNHPLLEIGGPVESCPVRYPGPS